jgi:NhaA family Na+:H+ antiporter
MEGNSSYVNSIITAVMQPLRRFISNETAGSKLLLISTIIALVWANSLFSDQYFHLWETTLSISIGSYVLAHSLGEWINDGLMVIFFLVVGLEIKRELLVGELSTRQKAVLPMIAALGGMVVPAIIFLTFNFNNDAAFRGWGIPVATDIAFALGCIMVLGHRIPSGLKVCLMALAIVDDLGAILVIAIFYTSDLNFISLGLALFIILLLVLMNLRGVRALAPYLFFGFFLWLTVLHSGIHATIAGVLLAMTIPARATYNAYSFISTTGSIIQSFPHKEFSVMCTDPEQIDDIKKLEYALGNINTPLQKLVDAIHPTVSFFIIPLFALANAGVDLRNLSLTEHVFNPVFFGIALGLFLGKQVGITLASWLAVKIGIARLPAGVNWMHMYGMGILGGIGFTMSLFIANLAFVDSALMEKAKIAIFSGSILSAVVGLLFLALYYSKSHLTVRDLSLNTQLNQGNI